MCRSERDPAAYLVRQLAFPVSVGLRALGSGGFEEQLVGLGVQPVASVAGLHGLAVGVKSALDARGHAATELGDLVVGRRGQCMKGDFSHRPSSPANAATTSAHSALS